MKARVASLWRALPRTAQHVLCAFAGVIVGLLADTREQYAWLTAIMSGVSITIMFVSASTIMRLNRRVVRRGLTLNRQLAETARQAHLMEETMLHFTQATEVQFQDPAGHQHRFRRVGKGPALH